MFNEAIRAAWDYKVRDHCAACVPQPCHCLPWLRRDASAISNAALACLPPPPPPHSPSPSRPAPPCTEQTKGTDFMKEVSCCCHSHLSRGSVTTMHRYSVHSTGPSGSPLACSVQTPLHLQTLVQGGGGRAMHRLCVYKWCSLSHCTTYVACSYPLVPSGVGR